MKNLINGFFRLCGDKSIRIKQSIILGFIDGVFESMPFLAVFYLFHQLSILNWKAVSLTNKNTLIIAGVFLAGITGRWVMKYFVYNFQSAASYDAVAQSRLSIGDHLKQAPMGYFNSNSIGDTVTTLTDDLHYIEQNAANILEKAVNGCINAFVLIIGVTVFNLRIGIVFLAGSILSFVIISFMQSSSLKAVSISKHQQNQANSKVIEYLKGLSVYKLFPESQRTGKEMLKVFHNIRDSAYGMEKAFIGKNLLFLLTERCICGLIMILTGILVIQKSITIENAILMFIAIFVIYKPLENLGSITGMVRMMEVSLNRIEKMQNIPVISGNSQTCKNFKIELEDVSFKYEQNQPYIINQVSFTIPEKSFTAIVGASGCGKTTLARLIARFWDCTSGKIKIGEINVKDINTDELYSYFSIVFQNVFLFNDTIENNIKMGNPNATHEEVIASAKKACCYDFIEALPDKYNTIVGENGGNLSGGEKQRISIARAILKNAPIILLDEATSSVDPENEWLLQQAIQELIKGKTVIMIAHKMSTIMNTDQIVVMDLGTIHGIGKHDDLLNTDSIYTTFWNARKNASQWKI